MGEKQLVQRVAAKAVIEAEDYILALRPSKIDVNKKWHIPGGIRDDINEPLWETAVREVSEETGINLTGVVGKVIKIGEWQAVDKGEQVKILGVFFHFVCPVRPAVMLSQEHGDFAWLDRNNYQNYLINNDLKEVAELIFG